MSVVIVVDGIIRKTRDQSPLVEGLALYQALNATHRVLLLAEDREKTDIWLRTNNMSKALDDIYEIKDSVFKTIDSGRSKGKIDFVITDDSDLAKQLLEVGIPVLVFLHPKYVRPEFRPDAREGVRSWGSITAELDKQQGLFMEDVRLSTEEDIEYEDLDEEADS